MPNLEQTLSSVTLEYEEIYVISLFKRIQIRPPPHPTPELVSYFS